MRSGTQQLLTREITPPEEQLQQHKLRWVRNLSRFRPMWQADYREPATNSLVGIRQRMEAEHAITLEQLITFQTVTHIFMRIGYLHPTNLY